MPRKLNQNRTLMPAETVSDWSRCVGLVARCEGEGSDARVGGVQKWIKAAGGAGALAATGGKCCETPHRRGGFNT